MSRITYEHTVTIAYDRVPADGPTLNSPFGPDDIDSAVRYGIGKQLFSAPTRNLRLDVGPPERIVQPETDEEWWANLSAARRWDLIARLRSATEDGGCVTP